MTNKIRIKRVEKVKREKVYDIHHKISPENFLEDHPNIVANGMVISNCGRHAGGVIISDNVYENMPVKRSNNVMQTPWTEGLNGHQLEPLGFLKFDILAVGTLRVVEDTIRKIIAKKTGALENEVPFVQVKEWFEANLHPDNNAMDDQEVYEHVYHKGNWSGIFQFAQPPVRKFVMALKPRSINDISATISIYRPGPLCLSEDTEVLVRKNKWNKKKEYRWKTIKQLFEQHQISKPTKILSLNEETKKLVSNQIQNVFHSGKKEVFTIKIQQWKEGPNQFLVSEKSNKNRLLEATSEHLFLTTEGWKKLSDLQIGSDYLLVQNKPVSKSRTKKHISGKSNFRNLAFSNYQYKCAMCDWSKGSLDVNHISGNRNKNNEIDNLGYLCPNCHRQFTEGTLSKKEIVAANQKYKLVNNDDIRCVRYMGCASVGFKETYDISMLSPHNNFVAGGFIVHNSAGVDRLYLQNRANKASIKYKHPMLKEILDNQEGCIAGNTLVETDIGQMTVTALVDRCNLSEVTLGAITTPKIKTYNTTENKVELEEIVAIKPMGKKSTITIAFDDGTFLTLTEDHIVFTKDGEKEAGQLTEEDEILSIRE